MKRWKVCVAGAGMFSETHLEAWSAIENAEVVALIDPSVKRLNSQGDRWDISRFSRFTSFEEAMEHANFDVVDIVTPLSTHVSLATMAAQASKHVLCQKPFATCPDEGRRAIAACKEAGVRIMVAEAFRWRAHYLKIKQLLADDALGPVHFAKICGKAYCSPRWDDPSQMRQSFFLEMPRLILQEMGPHWFDVYIHLFGRPTHLKSVYRRVSPHVRGEDLAVVLLQHDTMIGVIEASWASREMLHGRFNRSDGLNTMEHVVIDGSKASLILDADGVMRLIRGPGDVEKITYQSEAYVDAHIRMHRHFLHCLENDLPFATSAEENLQVLELIESAYASGRNGRP